MDTKNALQMLNVFKDFTKENGHQELTLTAVHIFMVIANNLTATSHDLRGLAGVDAPTVSRVTQTLSMGRKRGNVFQEGMDLIKLHVNPMDYRSNTYSITPKGQKILDAIKQI